MNDAEYVFKETSRERKCIARSAKSLVRGGGRTVRMPSDALTKGERAALNGEVKGYNLAEPMKWARFRAMPVDLQQEYLNRLVARFPGLPNKMIAEMFGIAANSLNPYLFRNKLKINRGSNGGRNYVSTFIFSEAGKQFAEWMAGAKPDDGEAVANGPADDVVEEPTVPVKTAVGDFDVNNISVLLRLLAGTGAELTIKIKL